VSFKTKSKEKFKVIILVFGIIFATIALSTFNYEEINKNEAGQEEGNLKSSKRYDPAGLIALWSGSVNTIPIGWNLCNGSLGTPDMINKFIKVTDNKGDLRNTGGSASHNHSYNQVPSHRHENENNPGDWTTSEDYWDHDHDYYSGSSTFNAVPGSDINIIGPTSQYTGWMNPNPSHTHNVLNPPGGVGMGYTSDENIRPSYTELAFFAS